MVSFVFTVYSSFMFVPESWDKDMIAYSMFRSLSFVIPLHDSSNLIIEYNICLSLSLNRTAGPIKIRDDRPATEWITYERDKRNLEMKKIKTIL